MEAIVTGTQGHMVFENGKAKGRANPQEKEARALDASPGEAKLFLDMNPQGAPGPIGTVAF